MVDKKIKLTKPKVFKSKFSGKRIIASDENLLVRTLLINFLFLYSILFIVFNTFSVMKIVNYGYNLLDFLSLIRGNVILNCVVPAIIAGAFLALFCYYKSEYIINLKTRQLLAQMIIYNNLCDISTESKGGWFTDVSFSDKKRITYFPKMYYERFESVIILQIGTSMKSYQEKLLDLDNILEVGLFCEVVGKEQKEGLTEYTLLPDVLKNRISIDDVTAKNGTLQLMKNVSWKYDKLPHMLIAGGTGGGKTYLILTLIECLLRSNAELTVLDPKNADIADLGTVMPNVYYKKEDIIEQVNKFYDEMVLRSENMKTMSNYKTGKNYAYLGLPAHFLVFDEYVAFMDMLTSKENFDVISKLKRIVMLGRQAGYFLIMACQRPDAKYFGEGIRDQFHFRLALGLMSEIGYGMMFGETKKKFCFKDIKGRGYFSNGSEVITEFYTPIVSEDHDFLKVIGDLYNQRQAGGN